MRICYICNKKFKDLYSHGYKNHKGILSNAPCLCGCGYYPSIGSEYICGHSSRISGLGKNKSPEHIAKIAKTLRSKYSSGEIKVWNKGKTKNTDERIGLASKKSGLKHRELWKNPAYAKHMSDVHKGKWSDEKKELHNRKIVEFYKNNPNAHPLKRMGKKGFESYPEKIIREVLEKDLRLVIEHNNISYSDIFIQEFRIGRYRIDFAFPELKLAIEIDGRFHQEEHVKRKDEIRDKFLKNLGWKVYRIAASLIIADKKAKKI